MRIIVTYLSILQNVRAVRVFPGSIRENGYGTVGGAGLRVLAVRIERRELYHTS